MRRLLCPVLIGVLYCLFIVTQDSDQPTPSATPTATELPCEMKCGGTPQCLQFCQQVERR
jgi:hypothetical protein